MKPDIHIIIAILKKDILGLLPLIALSTVIFFMVPAVANLQLGELVEVEFWVMLQANFYWLGFFLSILLMISVLQQDPAVSLHHDWLTRPISRLNWLLAKLLFMLVAIVLPILIGRLVMNLGAGLGLGFSLTYALGIEKIGSLLFAPVVFVIALLTPNFKRFIGLLMLMFLVFLMPAWSVTRTLLMAIGITMTSIPDALMWVQAVVMFCTFVTGIGLVYWFLYCRRQHRLALFSFWMMTVTFMFLAFPPNWLYDQDGAIAMQKWAVNSNNDELDAAVVLEHPMACFPSARINAAFHNEFEEAHLTRARWMPEALFNTGENPLSLATTIRYREQLREWYSPSLYPREHNVKWRLDRIRTRASYSADSLSESVPLQRSYTAHNRFDPIAETETDYWLLADEHIDQLASDPSTQLHLHFDLALLAPTPYELPVDGERYQFPDLGSCTAELDSLNNEIEIECLKRGNKASLISAELIGVPKSRIDNFDRATYTGDWVESLGRSRTELTLSRVSLVDHSSVLLTAYNVERILSKELVFDGMLGNDTSICPMPGDESSLAYEHSSWSDNSPHVESSVSIGNGVRLQLLDWRGDEIKDAPTLLLIHGLGATAHSWDDFAPQLAEHYNVVAMTRRGIGESSKPDQGYDIATLSNDVLAVMDALELEQPILVGHSLGGEELSYIGAHFSDRVSGLVYADAAYDRTGPAQKDYQQLSMRLPPAPPVRPAERTSYASMQAYSRRIGRNGMVIPEGEILATYDLTTGGRTFNELYLDAIMMGLQAPRYSEFTVPALGLYAVPGSAEAMMEAWYDKDDPVVLATVQELFQRERRSKMVQIERFETEIPDARAVILADANHWIFATHAEESLAEIRQFVDGLNQVPSSD